MLPNGRQAHGFDRAVQIHHIDRFEDHPVANNGVEMRLDFLLATLRREPPRWTRVIRQQARGGFRSYMLEWPDDGGQLRSEPLRAVTWERAESEADFWIATHYPEMYGQVSFDREG